jgi:hypothetical protein
VADNGSLAPLGFAARQSGTGGIANQPEIPAMYDVKKQARSAAEAYKMRQANITIQLAALLDAQRAHAGDAAKEPRHWGYAGDLESVEELLSKAVEALGGKPVTA